MNYDNYKDSNLIDEAFGYDPEDKRYKNAFVSIEGRTKYENYNSRRNYLNDSSVWKILQELGSASVNDITKKMNQTNGYVTWADGVAGSLKALKNREKVRIQKDATDKPWDNRLWVADGSYVDCPNCLEEVESWEIVDYKCAECRGI